LNISHCPSNGTTHLLGGRYLLVIVADPHYLDADPHIPNILACHHLQIDPDPDLDPADHFDADPQHCTVLGPKRRFLDLKLNVCWLIM
jgi:hypothetical protein